MKRILLFLIITTTAFSLLTFSRVSDNSLKVQEEYLHMLSRLDTIRVETTPLELARIRNHFEIYGEEDDSISTEMYFRICFGIDSVYFKR